MKGFALILVSCVLSVNCGLLKGLLGSKSDKDETKKPDLVIKVVDTLDEGATVVVDALGNVINPDLSEPDTDVKPQDHKTNTERVPEVKPKTTSKNEVKPNVSNADPKPSKKEPELERKENENTTSVTSKAEATKISENSKLNENKNTTLSTDHKKEINVDETTTKRTDPETPGGNDEDIKEEAVEA